MLFNDLSAIYKHFLFKSAKYTSQMKSTHCYYVNNFRPNAAKNGR